MSIWFLRVVEGMETKELSHAYLYDCPQREIPDTGAQVSFCSCNFSGGVRHIYWVIPYMWDHTEETFQNFACLDFELCIFVVD